jgi:hypothetical protein
VREVAVRHPALRELAPRAIAAVERVDARFFQPVAVGEAVALLGRLAHPAT